MFLIKKAVFKPIDCKDSANRTQYQKKSKDFLLALLRCRQSYPKIVQGECNGKRKTSVFQIGIAEPPPESQKYRLMSLVFHKNGYLYD